MAAPSSRLAYLWIRWMAQDGSRSTSASLLNVPPPPQPPSSTLALSGIGKEEEGETKKGCREEAAPRSQSSHRRAASLSSTLFFLLLSTLPDAELYMPAPLAHVDSVLRQLRGRKELSLAPHPPPPGYKYTTSYREERRGLTATRTRSCASIEERDAQQLGRRRHGALRQGRPH
jgi:hypothetical protein